MSYRKLVAGAVMRVSAAFLDFGQVGFGGDTLQFEGITSGGQIQWCYGDFMLTTIEAIVVDDGDDIDVVIAVGEFERDPGFLGGGEGEYRALGANPLVQGVDIQGSR